MKYAYKTRNTSDEDAAGSCIAMLIIGLIFAAIGAICWPYTINSWLEYAGKDPVIRWWQGALLGFVPYLGKLSIPAAVITWLLLMFL